MSQMTYMKKTIDINNNVSNIMLYTDYSALVIDPFLDPCYWSLCGHIKILWKTNTLDKNPTDNTKPQQNRQRPKQTRQSPKRLYKTEYIRQNRNKNKQNPKILDHNQAH